MPFPAQFGDFVIGSRRDDTLFGTNRDELILGRRGDDLIDGGGGSDLLRAGAGDDVAQFVAAQNIGESRKHDLYNGGRGDDTLRLVLTAEEWADDAVKGDVLRFLSFLESDAQPWQGWRSFEFETLNLTVRRFEGLQLIVDGVETEVVASAPGEPILIDRSGSTTDELIEVLGDGDATILTGSGNDTITTGSGDDLVAFGNGDDVAWTAGGNDTVVAGSGGGDDFIDLGSGDQDLLSYPSTVAGVEIDLRETDRSANAAVAAVLATVGLPDTTPVGIATGTDIGTDVLISAEFAEGGAGDDTIVGTDVNNRLNGVGGSDQLFGGAGTDTLSGGAGNDILDGGSGTDDDLNEVRDVVDYFNDAQEAGPNAGGVVVNFGTGVATDPFGDTDTLVDIEAAIGTNQADRFVGTSEFERFAPNGGNDTIDAGDEFDELDYSTALDAGGSQGIDVTFSATVEGEGAAIDPFGDTDVFTGIERVLGTNLDDTVTGGAGRQLFRGFDGADVFDGGDGFDRMDYRGQPGVQGILVDLTVVDANGFATVIDALGNADRIRDVEDIRGTFEFADTMVGNDNGNRFVGSGGDDTLIGNGGDDTLEGESGDDLLEGGSGDFDFIDGGDGVDTSIFSGPQANYGIFENGSGGFFVVDNVGSDGVDEIQNIEFVQFSDDLVGL